MDPWERRDTESDREWEAFRVYRDMRKPRSILRAAPVASVTLAEWSKRHEWAARVRAYDRHVEKIRLSERDALIQQDEAELTANRLELIRDAQELVQLELAKLLHMSRRSGEAPLSLNLSQLTRLFEAAIKCERLVRGESTEKIEVETSDFDSLSLDELRTLEELMRKAAK